MPPHPPKIIAVDVDGTLHQRGVINLRVVQFIKEKKEEGFEIILWSARGTKYARGAAHAAGIESTVDVITGKPGFILDDLGWGWIKYTRVIRGAREAHG